MLTPCQHQLLEFIEASSKATGSSPTYKEMMSAAGLQSKSGIHRMIVALEERGFIRRLPGKARAIEVIRKPGEDDLQRIKDQLRFAIEWIEGLPCLSAAQEHDKAAALKCLGRPHNVLALTGETPAEAAERVLGELTGAITDDIAKIAIGTDHGQRLEVL